MSEEIKQSTDGVTENPFPLEMAKPADAPKPAIVAHASGVAMGIEAFETGNKPEGVVSLTAIPVTVNKPEAATVDVEK